MKQKIKQMLMAIVGLLLSTTTLAHDFEVNGIYYNYLDNTAKTVKVTYKGSSYNGYSNEYTGVVSIPSSVTYSGTTYSVTSIGNYAFYNCTGLTSITIPNSVTSIGDYAFKFCSSLTSITIPNSVTSIGDDAFYDCYGLTSVTIGNSVTSIGNYAFEGCTGLTELIIEDGKETLSLGYNYYNSNSNYIGRGLFYDCPLEKLYIGRNLNYKSGQSYGYSPFYSKTKLKEVTIGNSVTEIGDYAFYRCSGLTSVTIPNSVTSIGYNAFKSCTGLTSVIVENGNSKYDSRDNCNAIVETSTNTLILGCKNSTIPNSVTSIGDDAFNGCYGLTSITIPNSVTTV